MKPYDVIAQAEARAPQPLDASSLEDLRLRYYRLRALRPVSTWESSDGKLLEQDVRVYLQDHDGVVQAHDTVFATPRMVALYWDVLNECDACPENILVLGERGVGKEVITRVIATHLKKKSVAVNCSALVESVAESLLFGIAGGSGISGVSIKGSPGFVQQATGGVLFLDELFDAPPAIFPKLLRLLQQRTFFQVGNPKEQSLQDTLIIGASNTFPTRQKLQEAVASGALRADMVDRFSSVLEIPPLRERREEIPHIAERFLASLHDTMGHDESGRRRFPFLRLTPESHSLLREPEWSWPGNIRTLERVLRMQGVLQRHGPQADHALRIPREALEGTEVLRPVTGERSENEPSLSAWTSEGIRQLREHQLLDFLQKQMVRENLRPEQLRPEWVGAQVRQALGLPNVTQRLRDSIGKTCAQLVRDLQSVENSSLPAGHDRR